MKKKMNPFATEAQEAHQLTHSMDTLAIKTNIKAGTDGLAQRDERADIREEDDDLTAQGPMNP
ncbi:MAG TPA: hypothetical protein PLS70_20485 [Acidobacteriota bacterium]|nr:hypothetical protein [Acidobacteriota bacterium]